ncbi:MAG TPA: sigma-70 family RNA polymerase sigma factor [Chitinophagaceae bacterium]|nr:sigma-70 family RNA polymerase sigma factor [Chitinophagaceae bacterium]
MTQLNAELWVNNYSDMLYRYALPRVNDSEIAKDLVQDTFLAAWRNYDNFKGEISEKNWLFTILKNKIIDHFRKASTRLTDNLPTIADEEAYFDDAEHWTAAAAPQQWGNDFSETISRKEFYEVLGKCRRKLKDIQAAVFSMKYLEGLDSDEICKELNLTPSNFWVLMHRAKLNLRACLEKNWFLK